MGVQNVGRSIILQQEQMAMAVLNFRPACGLTEQAASHFRTPLSETVSSGLARSWKRAHISARKQG